MTRASTHLRRTLAGAALAALLMGAASALPVAADHCYSPIGVGDIYGNPVPGPYDCHAWGLEETGSILIDPIQPPVAETGSRSILYALDSDGDGLTDGEELSTYGTDPNYWDGDGDGDGTEVYGCGGWTGNPLDPLDFPTCLN